MPRHHRSARGSHRIAQGAGVSALALLACYGVGCGGGTPVSGELVVPPVVDSGNAHDSASSFSSGSSSGSQSDDGSGLGDDGSPPGDDSGTDASDDGPSASDDASDDGATDGPAGDSTLSGGSEGGADGGADVKTPGDGAAADGTVHDASGDGPSGSGSSGGSSSGSSGGGSSGSSSGTGSSGGSSGSSSGTSSGASSGGSSSGASSGGSSSGASSGGSSSGASSGGSSSGADAGGTSDSGAKDSGTTPPDGGSSTTCGGVTCTNANGSTACVSGVCTPSCASGYADCDGNANNGCETDTNTSASHCGACGTSCSGTTPACTAGQCGCNLDVSWALKIQVNVSWPSTGVVNSGGQSGSILGGTVQYVDIWALVSPAGTPSGLAVASTIQPCNVTLPDFASILGETYGVTFPTSLFDHTPPYLAAQATTLTFGAATPSTSFSLPGEMNLIGMSAPATGTWPSASSGVTETDMDADGEPGVTTLSKIPPTYAYVPTSLDIFNLIRADKLYMAIRFATSSLSGSMTDCNDASGSTGSVIVDNMDSHILGCELQGTTTDCDSTQATFVDSNRPVFVINSASFTAKTVTTASCSAVRTALP